MPGSSYYTSGHWRALRARRLALDGHTCVVPGCGARAVVVDHLDRRKPKYDCAVDDLRSLCRYHDNQVKERPHGGRSNGGRFKLKGCDLDGWPPEAAG